MILLLNVAGALWGLRDLAYVRQCFKPFERLIRVMRIKVGFARSTSKVTFRTTQDVHSRFDIGLSSAARSGINEELQCEIVGSAVGLPEQSNK